MECRKKNISIPCVNCGKVIIRNPSKCKGKQLYCSVECHREWGRKNLHGETHPHWKGGITYKTRVCVYCGKEFKTKHSDGKFCCREHHNIWMHENLTGNASPHYKRTDTQCKQCGAVVKVTPARLKKTKSIFCSTICRDTWTHEHPGKEHPSFNSRYSDCIICGKEFKITKHWEKLGRIKYCSQECYWRDLEVGGTREYCIKWTPELRQRISLFWNNTCSICGEWQVGGEPAFHRHHVYYNKESCCIKNDLGIFTNLGITKNPHTFKIVGTPNKFALVCSSCHPKTSIKKNREYYARFLEEIINNKYRGSSYYTIQDMLDMGWILSSRNKWVTIQDTNNTVS
jgi:hypothetical protein